MGDHPADPNTFHCSFVDGARLEILGPTEGTYRVEFTDTATGAVVHDGEIGARQWIRTARRFFTEWQVDAYRVGDGARVFRHRFDGRGRRVYLAFESKALGDTLAWMPAVEAFQQRHRCEVVCSTFLNDLLQVGYPRITFVEPGTVVRDLYAMYRLGWFYRDDGHVDPDHHRRDFRQRPLGESAYDILGLPFVETRPRVRRVPGPRPLREPYVCIGVHATAQAKYWNNVTGWADVVRFLGGRGYRVVLLSKEGATHMGNAAPDGVMVLPPGPLEDVLRHLQYAAMFIGVGSGLAWLAWAVGCPTCVISGFSLPYTEMRDCIRVSPPPMACAGCFNRHRLDAGDWEWCPEHRDTPRMFECSREITGEHVIASIRDHL